MSKSIMFSYDDLTSDYTAVFYDDHRVFDSKHLTHVEVEGLSEIIDFAHVPMTLDADQLNNHIHDLFFDTEDEGQETNFEIMLQKLILQP